MSFARFIPSLCLVLLCAGPARAESLVASWHAALGHDPNYLSAAEARTSGAEAAVQGRALFLPQLKMQAGLDQSRSSATVEVPDQYRSLVDGVVKGAKSSVDVVLSQPLYDESARARARGLKEQAKAAQTRFSAQQQQLMLRVAEAWLDLLAADDDLRVIRSQKATLENELKGAQARFALGRARITDVRESQAQFDLTVASEFSAMSKCEIALARYREITGLGKAGDHGLSEAFAPLPPRESLDLWQTQAQAQAPDVRSSAHQLAIAQASVDQYRWYGRPQVTALASYSGAWLDGGGGRLLSPQSQGNYAVGLRLTVPLGTGGYYPSKLRESLADVRKAEWDLADARRNLRLEVQQAWLGVANGAEQIKALRTALASSQLQQRAAVTGRTVGNRTQSDVLAAQTTVYSTTQKLNAAGYDYQKSRMRLAAAAGSLDEDLLADVERDFQLQ